MSDKKYDYLIFDFNGTLYDDVDVCLDIENSMMKEFGIETMNKEKYLSLFQFPIINYYKALGFDFDKYDFKTVAYDFVKRYMDLVPTIGLNKNVERTLKELKARGYHLIMLSATKESMLLKQLEYFDINKYFDEILGIDNVYAKSKVSIAKNFVERNHPKSILMIGDTDHDLEVSNEINAEIIFVSFGHQSKERLEKHHKLMIDDFADLLTILD